MFFTALMWIGLASETFQIEGQSHHFRIRSQIGQRLELLIGIEINRRLFRQSLPHRTFTGIVNSGLAQNPRGLHTVIVMNARILSLPQQVVCPAGIGRSETCVLYSSKTLLRKPWFVGKSNESVGPPSKRRVNARIDRLRRLVRIEISTVPNRKLNRRLTLPRFPLLRRSLRRRAIFLQRRPKLLENRLPQVRDGAMGPPALDTEGEVVGDIVGDSGRAVDVTETDGVAGTMEAAIELELEGVCWLVTDGDTDGLFELDMSTEGDIVGDEEGLSITIPDVDTLGEGVCEASDEMDADGVPLASTVVDGDALASDETVVEGLTELVISALRLADGVMIDVTVVEGDMEVVESALVDGDGEKDCDAVVVGETVEVGSALFEEDGDNVGDTVLGTDAVGLALIDGDGDEVGA